MFKIHIHNMYIHLNFKDASLERVHGGGRVSCSQDAVGLFSRGWVSRSAHPRGISDTEVGLDCLTCLTSGRSSTGGPHKPRLFWRLSVRATSARFFQGFFSFKAVRDGYASCSGRATRNNIGYLWLDG